MNTIIGINDVRIRVATSEKVGYAHASQIRPALMPRAKTVMKNILSTCNVTIDINTAICLHELGVSQSYVWGIVSMVCMSTSAFIGLSLLLFFSNSSNGDNVSTDILLDEIFHSLCQCIESYDSNLNVKVDNVDSRIQNELQ